MAEPPTVTRDQVADWFARQVPDDWFEGSPHLEIDREEIVVTGTLAPPEAGGDSLDELAHAQQFREATREARIAVASQAEAMFSRKVSWVVVAGESTVPYSTLSVPVMTRLRFEERQVLDTLIAAGVARSRSDALGWCVRQAAERDGEWFSELREAMTAVAEVRSKGPDR